MTPSPWTPTVPLDLREPDHKRAAAWIQAHRWTVRIQHGRPPLYFEVAAMDDDPSMWLAQPTMPSTLTLRRLRLDVHEWVVPVAFLAAQEDGARYAATHRLSSERRLVTFTRTWPLPNLHDLGAVRRFCGRRGHYTHKRMSIRAMRNRAIRLSSERRHVTMLQLTGFVSVGHACVNHERRDIYFWPNIDTNPDWWPEALVRATEEGPR